MRSAVFFDRDGVLIEDRPDFVRDWQDVAILPAAERALAFIAPSDFMVVIASNQSGIGRGIVSKETVDSVNARLVKHFENLGGRIDRIYICPHHPDAGCDCRKPKPGMLLRARDELDIDLSGSFLIGDALRDAAAAAAAGVHPLMVLTGRAEAGEGEWSGPTYQDAEDAVKWIINSRVHGP
ncbi:MAG: HAD-IIIA family hydrolase [Armatimonadetes bacterium]|nr:HAD-IIIA family hydrolase [Armatimonadota bacterium]